MYFKMKSEDIQANILSLTKNQQLQFYLLLKSQDVPFNLVEGKLFFDAKHVPEKLLEMLVPKVVESPEITSMPEAIPIRTVTANDDTKEKVKKKERKVTITEGSSLDNIDPESTPLPDIDELERKMKQSITLKPSQLRIKRKIKDLLKKIAKHKHACPEKSYGQELNDRDDDGEVEVEDVLVDDDIGTTEVLDDESKILDDSSEFAGDNDDADDMSAEIFEQTEEDGSTRLVEDDDETENAVDDASVLDDTDDVSEFNQSVDEENIEIIMDSDVLLPAMVEVDSTRLNFKGTSLEERFNIYKDLLEKSKKMEFGSISALGIDQS